MRGYGRSPPDANAPPALSFAPDGRTLATGSFDGSIEVWDVAGRRVRQTLNEGTSRVTALDFAPDGRTLAVGRTDASVQLWDLAGHFVRQTLQPGTAPVTSVDIAPDGRALATAGDDGVVTWRRLALPGPAQAVALLCAAVDRQLTAAERARYAPGSAPASACGS
ncbi:WD40 repeat domain-containing protein [Streptomyces sp. V4-01]|uniref:WD40 repeat domain-containing protein n=1 Tax=Actinacidiphila polyblastidii TaxID=3110430 RepID=A0ABU7PH90_9ACTN|nr:WD40 repeat domain-containing protein [Streptomyces sp. V4-01]